MKYGILILTILFTTQLFAKNYYENPQVLRIACQGMRFGEPVNTVAILTQTSPNNKDANELSDFEEFERTGLEILFSFQMIEGQIDLSTEKSVADSTKSLLKKANQDSIKEVEVTASRYLSMLKFNDAEQNHYFENEMKFKTSKYKGSFIKYMKFQCSKPFYVDFKEPKPGMQNKSGKVQIDTIQDGDACTIGKDPECVETETNATN